MKTRPSRPSPRDSALEAVKLCCRVLDEKKAGELKVLDVGAQSSITDYLVLATGTSDPHLRALRIELEKALDAASVRIVGIDTGPASGWTVIDAFEVMVHIFTPENRAKYRLDGLWKDAAEVPLAKLLAVARPRKRPAKKGA